MKSCGTILFVLMNVVVGCVGPFSVRNQMREACFDSDVERLSVLLQEGALIDAAVDDKGRTLLHLAVIYQDDRLIDFLLIRGASRFVQDNSEMRPIDIAYSQSLTNICELLALKSCDMNVSDGKVPECVLKRMFNFYTIIQKNGRKTLFQLNGKKPPPEIITWIQKNGLNLLITDSLEYNTVINKATGKKEWRDKVVGDRLSLCEVRLLEQNDKKFSWDTFIWFDPEPADTGVLAFSESMVKQYGYWLEN